MLQMPNRNTQPLLNTQSATPESIIEPLKTASFSTPALPEAWDEIKKWSINNRVFDSLIHVINAMLNCV
jgi:hypothetical protein